MDVALRTGCAELALFDDPIPSETATQAQLKLLKDKEVKTYAMHPNKAHKTRAQGFSMIGYGKVLDESFFHHVYNKTPTKEQQLDYKENGNLLFDVLALRKNKSTDACEFFPIYKDKVLKAGFTPKSQENVIPKKKSHLELSTYYHKEDKTDHMKKLWDAWDFKLME